MKDKDHISLLAYRVITGLLSLTVLAFGLAIGTGYLQVRQPQPVSPKIAGPLGTAKSEAPAVAAPAASPSAIPKCHVQRDKLAEELLQERNAKWVYKFTGGWPKCWAEIESEGNKQLLGPWRAHTGLIEWKELVPESVEGYVVLFLPASKEQTYRMLCAVTRCEYRKGANNEGLRVGFRQELQITLPELLPPRESAPIATSGKFSVEEGELMRTVWPGEDVELNFLNQTTPSGKGCDIRLKLRFLTPADLVADTK